MRPLISATITLLIAACAAAPGASNTQTTHPEPTSPAPATPDTLMTASPTSALPTPAAVPTTSADAPYVPEIAVRVVTAGLRMRAGPSTTARIVKSLDENDILVLRGWPETVEGYVWYPATKVASDGVIPDLSGFRSDPKLAYGWVAVRRSSLNYVAPLKPRCPPKVDLASLSGMLTSEHLVCFGGTSLELEGVFGCAFCDAIYPGSFEPRWLADYTLDFLSVDAPPAAGPFQLHFSPGGPIKPAGGSIVRVRGHFDDPAALTCVIQVQRMVDDGRLHPVDPAIAIGSCRQAFVVDSYEILGTDPDFAHE